MSKSERLMELISLTKKENSLTVADISEKLKISKRTAYRYINFLNRVQTPLEHNNGTQIQVNQEMPVAKLTDDEIELICFCLLNNSLNGLPYFLKKFSEVEKKLLKMKSSLSRQRMDKFFEYKKTGQFQTKRIKKDIIALFTKAIAGNKTVSLTLSGKSATIKKLKPMKILLSSSTPQLVLKSSIDKKRSTVSVDQVENLKIDN